MILVDLLYNLSVLVALSVFSGFIDLRFDRKKLNGKLLQGLLFGLTAIIGMNYPFILEKGIIFDGRSVVISLCTLFFGPVSGLITTVIAVLYRMFLGGGGTVMGVSVISASFVIGYLFYRWRNKTEINKLTNLKLYLFGIIVHLAMLSLVLILPVKSLADTYKIITLTVIGIYPIITVLIAKILLDQEENKIFANKIKESETLYRTTLYSIGDGVITTDINSKIVKMNYVAEELTGWKEIEAAGKPLAEVFNIINEHTLEKVENPAHKVLKLGTIIGLANHTILISKNGQSKPIADSGAPIRDEKGNITGVVLVFRDQSGEYQSRKALIKSESSLSSIILNSPMGLHMFELMDDDNLVIVGANPAADKILGVDHKLFLGKSIQDVFPTVSTDEIIKNYKNVAKNGGVWVVDQINYEDECIKGIFEIRAFQIEQNKIAAFFVDVTNRVKAEQLLLENEEKYRILLDESTDPIFSFTPEGQYNYVNKAFAQGVGKTVNQIMGKKIWDVFDKDEADKRFAALDFVFKQGEGKIIEVKVPTEKGDTYYITTITPIKDETGKVSLVICSSKDITTRKKMEEVVAENEARIKSFMNFVPALILIKDHEMRPVYCNDSMRKLFPFDEWMGKKPDELFTADVAEKMIEKDLEALEKGSVAYEEDWIDFEGTKHIFFTQKFRINIANKNPMIGAIITDITERTRSEKILKIQYNIAHAMAVVKDFNNLADIIREELGTLIDSTNFFIAFFDEKTGILRSVNEKDENGVIPEWPAEKSLTGYLIKQNKTLLLHKEDFWKLDEEGIIEEIGVDSESWLGVPLRSGEKVFGAMVVQSYSNPKAYDKYSIEIIEMIANQLSGYIERKRAEDLLLESEDKFRSFAESSPFAIMIYQNENWVYSNPAGEEITGYSEEELYKMKFWEIAADEYKELIRKRGKDRQSGGDVPESYEFSVRAKNGDIKWVFLTGRPIIYLGQPAGFISVVDITDRKKIEEELIDAKEKAEEMNRVKSFFFANMSHELRTPFMPIMGYAELLSSILTDPDEKEMAEAILFSSRRLTETLKNVLDLTRLEFDKIEVSMIKVNLVSLIKEIFYLFRESAKKKEIELVISYTDEFLYSVTEEQFMREILTNFVSNAIKFTDTGYVEIAAQKITENDVNYILISVMDTGVGIPKDKQDVIWDEFRQVSEGPTRNFQGSGLGLAIVKRYADIMCVKLDVESEEGKGSVFTIKLLEAE